MRKREGVREGVRERGTERGRGTERVRVSAFGRVFVCGMAVVRVEEVSTTHRHGQKQRVATHTHIRGLGLKVGQTNGDHAPRNTSDQVAPKHGWTRQERTRDTSMATTWTQHVERKPFVTVVVVERDARPRETQHVVSQETRKTRNQDED